MRVTIAHNKTKAEAIAAVDRAIAEAMQNLSSTPVQIVGLQKSWQGPVMTFSFVAQMSFLKGPVQGSVEVGDSSVVITADLGMFGHFVPESKAQAALQSTLGPMLA